MKTALSTRILCSLLLVLGTAAYAAPSDWVKLAAQGNDEKAADELEKFALTLTRDTDAALISELLDLSQQLRGHCDSCKEKAKVILFRGFRAEENIGTKSKPFLASRALRDKSGKGTARGLSRIRGKDFLTMAIDHQGWAKHLQSPYVGTSVDPHIASVFTPEKTIAILKVCPERAQLNVVNNSREREVLIPFFAHSNEVLALVQLDNEGSLASGKFKVLYQADKTMSERATRAMIQSAARSASARASGSGFESRFSKYLESQRRLAGEGQGLELSDKTILKLMESKPGRAIIETRVLVDPAFPARPIAEKVMDSFVFRKRSTWDTRINEVLQQPHWLGHPKAPVWIRHDIQNELKGQVSPFTADYFKPELAKQPGADGLLLDVLRNSDPFDDWVFNRELSKSAWSSHPTLKELCGGKKVTVACLRKSQLGEKGCAKRAASHLVR